MKRTITTIVAACLLLSPSVVTGADGNACQQIGLLAEKIMLIRNTGATAEVVTTEMMKDGSQTFIKDIIMLAYDEPTADGQNRQPVAARFGDQVELSCYRSPSYFGLEVIVRQKQP